MLLKKHGGNYSMGYKGLVSFCDLISFLKSLLNDVTSFGGKTAEQVRRTKLVHC